LAERSIRCRVLGEPRPPQGERVAVVEMRQHGAHAVGEPGFVERALLVLPLPSPPAGLGAAQILWPQPQESAIDAEAEERQARSFSAMPRAASQPVTSPCHERSVALSSPNSTKSSM
jgi:hypothetical protein